MISNKAPIPLVPYWIDFSALYEKANAISRAYYSGNLVFFLGSGASIAFSPKMPSWDDLVRALHNLVEIQEPNKQENNTEILSLIDKKRYLLAVEAIKNFGKFDQSNKDTAIDETVRKILKQRRGDALGDPTLHLAILDFAVPIVTTNYDTIIEDLIAEYRTEDYDRGRPVFTYEDPDSAAEFLSPTTAHENYVFKLHGSLGRLNQHLILDENDYTDFYFRERCPVSLKLLRHILETKMVVFIGFSLSDPEIMPILREATRYASSYQHIALMHKSAIGTSTEREGLRANYKVDPILYDDYSDLALYVMEMRTFFPRESVALQIASEPEKLDRLKQALSDVQQRDQVLLKSNCSTILFGSYAKYGKLARAETDVDVFFLADDTSRNAIQSLRVRSESAEVTIGRRIDATVMGRTEFGRLLRAGDSFASHVLVTGCRLEDPDDKFGILARGFRGKYDPDTVLNNAMDRYRIRWLQICILENREGQNYLQACHQWALTLMQLIVIKKDYPLDSLLRVSMLANARYTMREFARRFTAVDESYYVSLMLQAKGIDPAGLGPNGLPPLSNVPRPTIRDMIQKFRSILSTSDDKTYREILQPGELIQGGDLSAIMGVYRALADLLDQLTDDAVVAAPGSGGVTAQEQAFLQTADEKELTTLDYLFFFRLHHKLNEEGGEQHEASQLEQCGLVRKQWLDEVAPSDGPVHSG